MKEDPINLIGVVGSLQQQRFITAVLKNYPDTVEEVMREFWLRSWSEDLDVHKAEDMTVVASKAGLESHQISHCLQEMKADDVKSKLKQVTAEAVDRGAFGAPTMFFSVAGEREEMFWGSDR